MRVRSGFLDSESDFGVCVKVQEKVGFGVLKKSHRSRAAALIRAALVGLSVFSSWSLHIG